jgi:hypothetical protein
MLPILLDRCPTCSAGIKQTRGWTWINGAALLEGRACDADPEYCATCPLTIGGDFGPSRRAAIERVGLMWVGKRFYATPEQFNDEASAMGISRRIAQVPKGFKVGESWVWLAHGEVIRNPADPPAPLTDEQAGDPVLAAEHGAALAAYKPKLPAVFRVWRPQRIEYVITGKESSEQIDRLIERGITPVHVGRAPEPQPPPPADETLPLFGDDAPVPATAQ